MKKKEGIIVFVCGIVLLSVFTFTDLQISMAVATKPGIARVLEVIGEIPFQVLTLSGCAMLIRFRSRENKVKGMLGLVGAGVLFLLFALMGGIYDMELFEQKYRRSVANMDSADMCCHVGGSGVDCEAGAGRK